jgi:hypothetical protein
VADVLYLLTLVAFFALMVAFVFVCERVVGKEDAAGSDGTAHESDATILEEVPA